MVLAEMQTPTLDMNRRLLLSTSDIILRALSKYTVVIVSALSLSQVTNELEAS